MALKKVVRSFGELDAAQLRERFPVIERIGDVLKTRGIPFVPGNALNDCGAACLAMVLGFYGREVRLDDVRSTLGVVRGGVSAHSLLEVGSLYELRGRALRLELTDLVHLPPGCILHWNLNHFVVFEKADGDEIIVLDPANGRRSVPMSQVSKSFSGVVLVFEPSDRFEASDLGDKPLWRYMRRALKQSNDWGRIVAASLFMQLFGSALPLINGRLIDRVVPRGDYQLLLVLVASFGFVVVFQFLTQLVRGHLFLYLRTRIDANITMGFLDHMLRLPYAFFQSRQTGDLLTRVNSISAIRDALTSSLLSGMIDGAMVCFYLVLLLFISPKLAGCALLIVMVQGGTYIARRRKLLDLAAANIAKKTEVTSYLTEVFSGIESLKAIGCESRAAERWAGLYVDLLNNSLHRGTISTWSDALMGTLRLAAPFVLLIMGVMEVMNGSLTLGMMLSANAYAFGFVSPVSSLIGTFMDLQFVPIQLKRIEDVLTTPPEQHGRAPGQLQLAPRLSGQIELRNVSFRYSPMSPMVLKNVSLTIEPGQMVALVGPSGSGKSTLASLLLGLYEPTDGMVHYDGTPLRDLDLRSVRRQMGVVVQKSYVFGGSIRSNIALADPDLPLSRVKKAAQLACLDADIEALGLGYDTHVVAGGGSLSGGQRQRLALARALVTDPAVLLLDEATNALDSLTERNVQRNLEALGCTRVIVAHRLATVKAADRILVVKDGQIVEQGTHEQLLAQNGVYCELVDAQELAEDSPRDTIRMIVPDSVRQIRAVAR